MKLFHLSTAVLFALAGLIVSATPSQSLAWGAMHSSITQGAIATLPQWQQDLLGDQRVPLVNLYCMIPDLAQAAANKREMGPFVVLPNGDLFSHLPFKTRTQTAYQIQYYVNKVIETIRANDVPNGARWAGCLLHFLEDSGSPAHTVPGDNQMGLMKDLLATPEAFQNLPFHSLIEEGQQWVKIPDYKPRLLGTTAEEAGVHLIERYNAMVRNARGQVIPIIEATYRGDQEGINAGQMRAATKDAEVVADALYTLFSIAKDRFEAAEVSRLETVDVSELTPVEVIQQSYFPQHTYFSNPYYGFPVHNGIVGPDKKTQPLLLNIAKDGVMNVQRFEHGIGLGTSFRITYALPDKVYDQFECLLGVHAELGKEGILSFKIFADGAAVFSSELLTGIGPAQKVSLPIWGLKELSIITENRDAPKGHNYAIIAEPLLRKAKDPKTLSIKKTE